MEVQVNVTWGVEGRRAVTETRSDRVMTQVVEVRQTTLLAARCRAIFLQMTTKQGNTSSGRRSNDMVMNKVV